MPADKVHSGNAWHMRSAVAGDTWTLEPHWPSIAPILESFALHDLGDARATLSIATNSRASGFAFDLEAEQISLLARAKCGVWIDSYEPLDDPDELPDDYPFPKGHPRAAGQST